MELKKHDFVEVEYTGRLKENNLVFDTTDEKTAKQAGIIRESAKFGPVIVCLGENHILKGIDDHLIGKPLGRYNIELEAEKAFGKKNAQLLKLIPAKVFVKEKIAPYPGLEVNIDNMYGIVRAVSGGRVIVDFNHPLAGKDVKYEVKAEKLVEDTLQKARSVFKNELTLENIKLEMADGTLLIEEKLPAEAIEPIKKRVIELIPEVKDVKLSIGKAEKNETDSMPKLD